MLRCGFIQFKPIPSNPTSVLYYFSQIWFLGSQDQNPLKSHQGLNFGRRIPPKSNLFGWFNLWATDVLSLLAARIGVPLLFGTLSSLIEQEHLWVSTGPPSRFGESCFEALVGWVPSRQPTHKQDHSLCDPQEIVPIRLSLSSLF